jgi:putative PIN family toxin of toxin-antitoxin system
MALRVVLDTSVLVSAFRSANGASRRLLALVADRHLVPLATTALFLEYESVLKRPEQRAVSGLSIDQVNAALLILASVIEPIDVRFSWRPQLPDPNDEMVLDAAINGRAEALVTHNITDFEGWVQRFGVRVVRPGRLLKEMQT